MSKFQHPQQGAGTISIASLDTGITVNAQYNPKELEIKKTVPWSKTNPANGTTQSAQSGQSSKGINLEFTGAEGRTMTLELMFDGYEKNMPISADVESLNTMASVLEPDSQDETKRRPHLCLVVWGATLTKFTCVIESITTKYTMFSSTGIPLRATCTLGLKEADSVTGKKQ